MSDRETNETHDAHEPHPASQTEASNGEGTVSTPAEGHTLDHPVLDGSTEDYSGEGEEKNPRYGMEDPGLIRDTESGEKKAPIPGSTEEQ
ncbi:hypothetical protein [Leucobacter massiliensis]|uniref:Uncharacterized protein n=1 Tax=Leucobacter massiliensis TaxID=1686285 RepID=A0A2S9QS60_9MICO|nr:hypothetical protein [Leucobacter massiliensis]PRI12423.1 hypothetical protein B4915_01780 [Leucobacter massiliensis]